jgi:primosomal protein N' (replication factor Y) (superfamily II helicase)
LARLTPSTAATPSLFGHEETPATASAARASQDRGSEGPLVEVVIARPVRTVFTYAVPPEMVAGAQPGARVVVPFGSLREIAVVIGPGSAAALGGRRARALLEVLDGEALIDGEILELSRWMAEEYACSWGETLHALLPAALKREGRRATVLVASVVAGVGPRELAEIESTQPKQHRLLRTLLEIGAPIELREVLRQLNLSQAPARTLERRGWIAIEHAALEADPLARAAARGDVQRPRPAALLPAQQVAVDALHAALGDGTGGTFLLEGITGSGKTEVYLALIERALALGRGAIVLVPEIALTPQTVGWFRSRFERVAVLHSRMTDVQRLETWHSVKRGEARVVVGARSALFAPVRDLGVVVVDEEHEPSFKQDSTPRYHAREVAVRRAELARAVCVLGSATPSLESWSRARSGRYGHLHLPERAGGGRLPAVEVLDLGLERRAAGGTGLFSARLAELLGQTLARGEQAILFQNRRGFAPVLWCRACRATLRCRNCDVTLTWHRRIARLVCHACCEESASPKACPSCTAPGLRPLGAGSERIESEIARLFPAARLRRMDSDTMRRREDYESALSDFGSGAIDVLVGTQMIAKGLDFPRVTLVGIVDADGALHLPEFRAAERTFQLIAQVAGRAGRGELSGRIVVQTHVPLHPAVVRAATHDFRGFAQEEDALRRDLGYPPHGRLVRALFEDATLGRAEELAARAGQVLAACMEGTGAVVLGPAPAPVAFLRGRHRQHVLVKCPLDGEGLARAREALLEVAADAGRVRMSIDVDPQALL